MIHIAVLGDVMLDVTLGSPEVLPSYEAESAFVIRGSGWRYNLGGAGNVAEVLGMFEWPEPVKPILVGVVGADEAGMRLTTLARKVCEPLHHGVMIEQGRVTTTKTRVGPLNLPRILPRLDVEDERAASVDWDFVHAAIEGCDAVVLADYRKGFFATWPEDWLHLMPDGANVPVVVDAKPADVHRYAGATVWCPSRRELAGLNELYAHDWSDLATMACADHGLRFTCVTLGETGCYVCAGDVKGFVPASARRTFVSAIGAGDAFCAGIAVSLAMEPDAPPETHVRFAQETAERYVTQERYAYA